MRVLSDKEDREFRRRVEEKIGFAHRPSEGWEPVDMSNSFVVEYREDEKDCFDDELDRIESGSQNYEQNFSTTIDFLEEKGDRFYILAFDKGQYVPKSERKFREEMNGNVVEVSHDEIEEITHELVVVYILPESIAWIILLDHDGNIHFSGEIKEDAKKAFE